ncbi:MAG: hypothetical protein QM831_45770 [Kofleriaceae bacterium]
MRFGVVVVSSLLVARAVVASPDTPLLTHSESDRENEVRIRANQQQLDTKRDDAERAKRESDRELEINKLAGEQWEKKRDNADHARAVGIGITVTGGLLGVAAVVMGVLGKQTNDSIKNGTLMSPAEIKATADRGQIYNYVAYGAIGLGSAFVIGGVLKIVFNLDPGEYHVEAMPAASGGGVSFGGRF